LMGKGKHLDQTWSEGCLSYRRCKTGICDHRYDHVVVEVVSVCDM